MVGARRRKRPVPPPPLSVLAIRRQWPMRRRCPPRHGYSLCVMESPREPHRACASRLCRWLARHHCHGIQGVPLIAAVNAGARIWLGGVPRGSAHHLAQRHHGRAPSVGRGGSQRAAFRDLRRHGRDGAVMGGSTRIRMGRGRLGHVYLPFHGPVVGHRVSPLPPGQDSGPTATIKIPAESAEARYYERHERGRSRRSHRRSSAPPVTPGSWPSQAADVRCLISSYAGIKKLASLFRNLVAYQRGELDLPDQSCPGSAVRGS